MIIVSASGQENVRQENGKSSIFLSYIFLSARLNSLGKADTEGLNIVRLLGDGLVRIEIIQHAQFAPSALHFLIGENDFADLVRILRLVFMGMITRPDQGT